MPKVYLERYCCRCGIGMRVCKPTFICPTCPVKIEDVVDKSCFWDYHTGKKITSN